MNVAVIFRNMKVQSWNKKCSDRTIYLFWSLYNNEIDETEKKILKQSCFQDQYKINSTTLVGPVSNYFGDGVNIF